MSLKDQFSYAKTFCSICSTVYLKKQQPNLPNALADAELNEDFEDQSSEFQYFMLKMKLKRFALG